jgi:membrane protein YqaA with SNARE-associated domain
MTAFDPSGLSTAAPWAATFLFALGSGLVPFVFNTELYLLGVAVLTDASPVAIVALMTAGQMLGKFAVSFMAGVLRIPVTAFLAIGTTGRVIRFATVFLFPELFR